MRGNSLWTDWNGQMAKEWNLESSESSLYIIGVADAPQSNQQILLDADKAVTSNLKSKKSPFIGSDGLFRVRDWLQNSQLDYGQKHQAILPDWIGNW